MGEYDKMQEIKAAIAKLLDDEKKVSQTLNALTGAIENMNITVKNLEKAFPNGDTDGHRRTHEAMIEDMAERKRLRIAIQEKTIAGLIWFMIVGIGYAIFHEVVRIVKQ